MTPIEIVAAVRAGDYSVRWATVRSEHAGHVAIFEVLADALMVGGVRVTATAEEAQIIADAIGCSLLTTKLADLIWEQRAVTLPPLTATALGIPLDRRMEEWPAVVTHSAAIDHALEGVDVPADGIVSTVGKHWVIDAELEGQTLQGAPLAMNHGWHRVNGPPIQVRGKRHNARGTRDYSQTLVFAGLSCVVDDVRLPLRELLADPELAPLANYTGRLRVLRQPGVPAPASSVVVLPKVEVRA